MEAKNLMKQTVRTILISTILLVFLGQAIAQPNSYPYKVQQDRMLFHDAVDKEQKRLLALDGTADDVVTLSRDPAVNQQVKDALINRVDKLQEKIEFDSGLNNNNKKKYLRSLE